MLDNEDILKNRETLLESNKHILLSRKHKGAYVLKQKIVYIEAYENYSWFHLLDGTKLLSCKSIGYYEEEVIKNYLKNQGKQEQYKQIHSNQMRLFE